MTDKVRENRARRAADRQGLVLEKCRRRDPRAVGYGMYRFRDRSMNAIGFGGADYGLDLEAVEEHLGITG